MSTRALTKPKQVEVDELSTTNPEAKIRRGISFLADLTRGALPADERSTAALAFIDVLDDDDCAPMLAADLRAGFVSAVLDLGYPYALHLKPEDLSPVRATSRARRSLPVGLAVLAGLVVGLLATTAFTSSQPATARAPIPVVAPPQPIVWPTSMPAVEAKVVNVKPVREASFEAKVLASSRSVPRGGGGAVSVWRPTPPSLQDLRSRQSVTNELENLVETRSWFEVIRAGDRCRAADPLRLDCLAHVAAAHAHLSRRPTSPLLGNHWKRLAALDRLEHDRAARALYRRYLSIALPDDPYAAKIVRALRADGDWVEPPGRDAKLELRVLHQTGNCNGEVECLSLAAATWAQRAARTHDLDDLAQAERAQQAADEARSRLAFRRMLQP